MEIRTASIVLTATSAAKVKLSLLVHHGTTHQVLTRISKAIVIHVQMVTIAQLEFWFNVKLDFMHQVRSITAHHAHLAIIVPMLAKQHQSFAMEATSPTSKQPHAPSVLLTTTLLLVKPVAHQHHLDFILQNQAPFILALPNVVKLLSVTGVTQHAPHVQMAISVRRKVNFIGGRTAALVALSARMESSTCVQWELLALRKELHRRLMDAELAHLAITVLQEPSTS